MTTEKFDLRKCPKCEAVVSDTAKKCKHCGSKLPIKMTKIRLISTIIIILFIIISCSTAMDDNETSPSNSSQTSSNSVGVGENGIVHVDNVEEWFLAIDEVAFKEMTKAAVVGDNFGLLELMANGKIFSIPNDTKIKVIDSGFAKVKVRILEGDKIGQSGWVSYEFVQK